MPWRGIDLRLPVKRQMIGILGYQHLSDQGFGRDAAFDNASRCWGLDDCALTRAATVTRPTGDQKTERGRDDIKPFSNILADLVQPAAAAWAGFILYIDNLLDPLEVRRQRAAVGLAGTTALGLNRSSLTRRAGCAKCRLDILKAQLELVGIKLLDLRPKRWRMNASMIDCSRSISASASPLATVMSASLRDCSSASARST